MMMFIPVIAVAVNHHVTVARNMWAFKQSFPLRFVWIGALMYTAASFQGATQALRPVQTVVHFTHYTVGHAHLGVYGFVSLILFGSIYYIMPRLLGRQWPYQSLVSLHFWLTVVGFAIYFVALTVGGVKQGYAMIDPARPFADSVRLLYPYLVSRSAGGALMTLGHLLFAFNFLALIITARKPQPIDMTGATQPAAS